MRKTDQMVVLTLCCMLITFTTSCFQTEQTEQTADLIDQEISEESQAPAGRERFSIFGNELVNSTVSPLPVYSNSELEKILADSEGFRTKMMLGEVDAPKSLGEYCNLVGIDPNRLSPFGSNRSEGNATIWYQAVINDDYLIEFTTMFRGNGTETEPLGFTIKKRQPKTPLQGNAE
ncbi:MAG: hypothetical protein AAFN77_23490 [Planctomycetota bacterium]